MRFVLFELVEQLDEEIIKVAKDWGCEVPFQRPMELAEDDTPGIAPVLHALEVLPGYDYVVLSCYTAKLYNPNILNSCLTGKMPVPLIQIKCTTAYYNPPPHYVK